MRHLDTLPVSLWRDERGSIVMTADPTPMVVADRDQFARPITRRQFVTRAAALGISLSAVGAVLEACGQTIRPSKTPSATPGPSFPTPAGTTFGGTLPVIDPTPTAVTYGAMLETSAFALATVPSATLRAILDEVAADASIPVAQALTDGRRQARVSVAADDSAFGSQAYRLEVTPTADGPEVAIRAGDEAGACCGLLSLGRLAAAEGPTRWLRAAEVEDSPGFDRRGAILDPWVLPDTGVTRESRALLLERVRFGVRYKLNFVDLPDRIPWPELLRYCDDHHVELMVGKGYRDALTVTPRAEVKRQLDELLDAGTRSIALSWDDIATTDPEALARTHADVFLDLYRHLRRRDPGIRVSAVLPPYGGVPGRQLVGAAAGDGERYLAMMRDALPGDVRVFWTGDGGVFSETVSAAGAQAYADAIGHELGLWDNNAIWFSRARKPCSGRAADLSSVVRTYMGNLAGEANWEGGNGEFALLTSLFYTWNPGAYELGAAAAAAERILARGA